MSEATYKPTLSHTTESNLACPLELSNMTLTMPYPALVGTVSMYDAIEQVLLVTAEGEFQWHPDAERLIEEGDYSSCPSLPFILRRLWLTEYVPPECQTEGEKKAFAFGWFKALEMKHKQQEEVSPIEMPYMTEEPPCSTHPDAPHGFDRNGSHNNGRYTCQCEGWRPE